MENDINIFNNVFFETLEKNIEQLPKEKQEQLYRPCAINCVQNYVLKEQQRLFEKCNGDYDLMVESGNSEYFFGEIIERGHIYEIGYPRCLCPVVESGMKCPPVHCECSRQSIIYVLNNLMPDKNINVEMLHTILTGANECRFRVTIERL